MSRFISAPAALVLGLALAAPACGVPEDPLTPPDLAVSTFEVTPFPPVAGQRTFFHLAGKALLDVDITQGASSVLTAINAPDELKGTFTATSADVPKVLARSVGGAARTLEATAWSETCLPDGRWRGALHLDARVGPTGCVFGADDTFASVEAELLFGGAAGHLVGEPTGPGGRDLTQSGCVHYFGLTSGGTAFLHVEGADTAQLVIVRSSAAPDGSTCKTQWRGDVTRD